MQLHKKGLETKREALSFDGWWTTKGGKQCFPRIAAQYCYKQTMGDLLESGVRG
jgi:hypothetical protein